MLLSIVMCYVLAQMNAPVWCFVLIGVTLAAQVFNFGRDVGKLIQRLTEQ